MHLLWLALLFASLLAPCLSTSVQAASRALGGWHATLVSTDRIRQRAYITDSYRWLRPLGVNTTLPPIDQNNFFNVSVGWVIQDFVLSDHFGWITMESNWNTKYVAIVDLDIKSVVFNKSITDFQWKMADLPLIAAPPYGTEGDWIYAFVQYEDNMLMYMLSTDGQQVPQNGLWHVASYNCFDIDEKERFWILQTNNVATPAELEWVSIYGQIVADAKVTIDLQGTYFYDIAGTGSGVAYMLALDHDVVYCWNFTAGNNSRCDDIIIPDHIQADIEIFNTTHFIIVDALYQGAYLYNYAERRFDGWLMSEEAALHSPSIIRATDEDLYVSQTSTAYRIYADTGVRSINYAHASQPMSGSGPEGIAIDQSSKITYISWRSGQSFLIDAFDSDGTLLRSMPVSTVGAMDYDIGKNLLWVCSSDQMMPSIIAISPDDGSVVNVINFTIPHQMIADVKMIGSSTFAVLDGVNNAIVLADDEGTVLKTVSLGSFRPTAFDVVPDKGIFYVVAANMTSPMEDSVLLVVDETGQIVTQLQVPDGYQNNFDFQGVVVRQVDGSVFATYNVANRIFQWQNPLALSVTFARTSLLNLTSIGN